MGPPVDIAIPTLGHQNHVSIDREHGVFRRWDVTDAAAYEGARLREGLLDKSNCGRGVGRHGAPRPTRRSSKGTASSAASTTRSLRPGA